MHEEKRGKSHNDKRFNSPRKITILNVYTRNTRASNCMKQKLTKIKGEIDKLKVIVRYVNIPLSETDETGR